MGSGTKGGNGGWLASRGFEGKGSHDETTLTTSHHDTAQGYPRALERHRSLIPHSRSILLDTEPISRHICAQPSTFKQWAWASFISSSSCHALIVLVHDVAIEEAVNRFAGRLSHQRLQLLLRHVGHLPHVLRLQHQVLDILRRHSGHHGQHFLRLLVERLVLGLHVLVEARLYRCDGVWLLLLGLQRLEDLGRLVWRRRPDNAQLRERKGQEDELGL
ncbi:hypothetical protein TPAR_01027 [Tolypocladium paradoxum]|uniref:Uncharacterized protein n=1 Tax=Tolypocladium paradoxum TaxID=94208 RepID=A0A2S4L8K0_9HYPO|nr:hypothetical protein TPAR_01027 [Tolypocladium paradoxum]